MTVGNYSDSGQKKKKKNEIHIYTSPCTGTSTTIGLLCM